MDKVIPAALRENVFVYLDDLVVCSPIFEAHMDMLSQVSACLQRAEPTINVDKSKFCYSQARYLGYVVGGGCIRTDDVKIQSIQEFPQPSSNKKTRRFLGMTGWYRRFIQNYAQTAAPLHDCLKKDRIKTSMATAPVLVTPDFKKAFTIQCDASTTGVGGVLFQTDDEGGEHPNARADYRRLKQKVVDTVVSVQNDNRFFAKTKVDGEEKLALLDTGASANCIGRGAHAFLENRTRPITVDGSTRSVIINLI